MQSLSRILNKPVFCQSERLGTVYDLALDNSWNLIHMLIWCGHFLSARLGVISTGKIEGNEGSGYKIRNSHLLDYFHCPGKFSRKNGINDYLYPKFSAFEDIPISGRIRQRISPMLGSRILFRGKQGGYVEDIFVDRWKVHHLKMAEGLWIKGRCREIRVSDISGYDSQRRQIFLRKTKSEILDRPEYSVSFEDFREAN